MTYSHDSVFLDYLTVTNRPDNTCSQDLKNYLLAGGAFLGLPEGNRTSIYFDPMGDRNARVQIKEVNQFVSIAATGTALAFMRAHSIFDGYLNILASVPHNVTRLDAAIDVASDAPPILAAIHAMYPDGLVKITRKYVPITRVLETRPDGQETGTIYFGKRGKSRIIARIYDKAWEQYCKRSLIVPPTTRYELECGRLFNASLKDAAEPYLLFWNHAQSFGLDLPSDLPSWVPAGDYSRYASVPRLEVLPLVSLGRRIDRSLEIPTLFHMANELGSNGLQSLRRLINTRLDQLVSESSKVA